MKKKHNKKCKIIKQDEIKNQELFNSKLNDTDKEQIKKYIDRNIGQSKERFCPHEFFKLVNGYQNEVFSEKEIKKIKKKYKKYKLNIFEDKYNDIYEEYFYKSKYFMYYFKTQVNKNYFDKTAKQLYEDYKYGFDLNIETRSKTIKYILPFLSGTLTQFIASILKEKKVINAFGNLLFIMLSVALLEIFYILSREFENNSYDIRLFKKLLQDEFDNN